MTEQPGKPAFGMSKNSPERPKVVAWGPSEGQPNRPIIEALRAVGIDCWVSSRREPANNFEVSCMAADSDRARDVILGVDDGATILTRGR